MKKRDLGKLLKKVREKLNKGWDEFSVWSKVWFVCGITLGFAVSLIYLVWELRRDKLGEVVIVMAFIITYCTGKGIRSVMKKEGSVDEKLCSYFEGVLQMVINIVVKLII